MDLHTGTTSSSLTPQSDLHVNVNVSCGMVPRFNTFFFVQEAHRSREVAWAVQWCTGVGLDRAAVASQ